MKKILKKLLLLMVVVSMIVLSSMEHYAYVQTAKFKRKHFSLKKVETTKKLLDVSTSIKTKEHQEKEKRKKIKTLATQGLAKVNKQTHDGYVANKKGIKVYNKVGTLASATVIKRLVYREKIVYAKTTNSKWLGVYLDNKTIGYIKKSAAKIVRERPKLYREINVINDKRKSYMDYRTITATDTPQYKMQRNGYTSPSGLRMVAGRYCVAVGSFYTRHIGQKIDVVLRNERVIKCVLGDQKKDIDTNSSHTIGADGGAVEFLVSTGSLSSKARKMGDVGYISSISTSPVKHIRIYKEYVF